MDVVVGSKRLAGSATVALDVSGREHLVLVAKATWSIPGMGERSRPLPPQPLAMADVFVGEPGRSAMLYGADLARFKPRCDVLFNASAHAPAGQPLTDLLVAWQVGPLKKGLRVVGPRVWRKRLGLVSLTKPEPFTQMPLHYGLAFGGSRTYQKGRGDQAQELTEAYLANPEGIGWFGKHTTGEIDEAPAPSLEALDDPIARPDGKHQPAAFSAVARHWEPRKQYAGTYDEAWQKNVFPFLPEDFDERFHQCAPEDQQMDYPKGGEPVTLRNLMANRDYVQFSLPALDTVQFRVLRKDYSTEMPEPVVDTLYFEPDAGRFSAVWRASVPIRRRLHEFDTVAIGPIDPAWWEAKQTGQAGGCEGCSEPGVLETAEGANP
ncbi:MULTISPECIES: DUF2169 family type VI secretion system accessory protein [Ralstonia solanacearum species complex]|uniref:DUF2169 domain-containing protein n=4 Tax=Ralstonia solanacearum TaxID=305 RepID=A0A7U7JFA6_RALSL|nr:DUF2169 domain-containing protein [Ralstonia solanacearum]ALF89664.1 hypothetical protein RSUY_33530 [Ralstonia solanacearum]ATI29177.1 DUF2169 domain-containing protein [Ralstonia solanacearum]EAP72201.1 hypothetical protein RRSL_02620 [Ralstonia solanacearum UW551]KEI33450.1 hypothetical protein CQ06_09895 [Ralstonia solanacearum]KFX77007.1 hypothetical protein KR98_21590 [Ralstonia solanacearum]